MVGVRRGIHDLCTLGVGPSVLLVQIGCLVVHRDAVIGLRQSEGGVGHQLRVGAELDDLLVERDGEVEFVDLLIRDCCVEQRLVEQLRLKVVLREVDEAETRILKLLGLLQVATLLEVHLFAEFTKLRRQLALTHGRRRKATNPLLHLREPPLQREAVEQQLCRHLRTPGLSSIEVEREATELRNGSIEMVVVVQRVGNGILNLSRLRRDLRTGLEVTLTGREHARESRRNLAWLGDGRQFARRAVAVARRRLNRTLHVDEVGLRQAGGVGRLLIVAPLRFAGGATAQGQRLLIGYRGLGPVLEPVLQFARVEPDVVRARLLTKQRQILFVEAARELIELLVVGRLCIVVVGGAELAEQQLNLLPRPLQIARIGSWEGHRARERLGQIVQRPHDFSAAASRAGVPHNLTLIAHDRKVVR